MYRFYMKLAGGLGFSIAMSYSELKHDLNTYGSLEEGEYIIYEG